MIARKRPTPPPKGNTPSWFTQLPDFLEKEAELLRLGLIPRPFDLDPCAHPESPVSRFIRARGGIIWTERDNGLTRSWAGRVPFVNPPYDSEEMGPWGGKMRLEGERTAGQSSLLPAFTDRIWWHDHFEEDRLRGRTLVQFVPSRLWFGWPGNPEGVGGDSAMFPSAWVTWRRPL